MNHSRYKKGLLPTLSISEPVGLDMHLGQRLLTKYNLIRSLSLLTELSANKLVKL